MEKNETIGTAAGVLRSPRFGEYLSHATAFAFKRRDLLRLFITTTNRCNSRCKICNVWKERKKIDISLDVMREILTDKLVTKRTYVGITGGEFILHPHYKEILDMLNEIGINYAVFSNGVDKDRLIRTVREFGIPEVQLSLDGTPETYRKVRGVDKYASIVDIIRELKSETVIQIGYVFNNWNTLKDYEHVKALCDKNGLKFAVGVYGNINYLNARGTLRPIPEVQGAGFYSDFLHLYNGWLGGHVILPCHSIKHYCMIWPNGDVPMCQQKDIILGNVYKNKLSDIWNSKRTRMLQEKNVKCNACWISCQRMMDVKLVTTLSKFMPKILVEKIVGKYEIGE